MKNEQRTVVALLSCAGLVGCMSFALLGCAAQLGSDAPEATATSGLAGVGGNHWRSALDPDRSLTQLSIAATHDSMARYEPVWGTAICQNLALGDQLNAGVRY